MVGSGAAGLNAAVQLCNQGIEDVLIVTEGLKMGTSINTGRDKQTYYKGAMCGEDVDAPRVMANNYFESVVTEEGRTRNRWVPCRPIPESDLWFESAWASYREGRSYRA